MKILPYTALCVAIATSSLAHAATAERLFEQNAPGICGAVDPADDIYLRRYPPSLYNAKPEPVQVICQAPSVVASSGDGTGTTYAGLYFKNNSAVSGVVACTAAAGTTLHGVTYKYKQLSISPGTYTFISWSEGTDYPAGNDVMSYSCTLPRGFAVHEIWGYYDEDIGS